MFKCAQFVTDPFGAETSLVEHDVKQRTVNFQPVASIVNKPKFSEPIHKEVHSRSSRTDHFRQGFLAYLRNDGLRSSFLPETGQQQESPRQPLFSRVKQLINQILLDLVVA